MFKVGKTCPRGQGPCPLQDTEVPVKDRLKGYNIPKVSHRPKEDSDLDDHPQEGSDYVDDDEAIEGFTSDDADSHPEDCDSGDEVSAPSTGKKRKRVISDDEEQDDEEQDSMMATTLYLIPPQAKVQNCQKHKPLTCAACSLN